MTEVEAPQFLEVRDAVAVHDRQLSLHGGLAGIKDIGLLESAMARPRNKQSYGEDDPFALAAAYAFGIARNHPFLDGNKRTAWVAARVFLRLNGIRIAFDRQDAIDTMVSLASGMLSEDAMGDWFRAHRIDL